MSITVNGSGTITGISAGGLPDGSVDADTLAANSVTAAKIVDGTIVDAEVTSLAASKLTGTIADARFPATLPAISGANLTGIETVTKSATAPGSPSEGDQWFNTSASAVSGVAAKTIATYNGTTWITSVPTPFTATGGTITTSGSYTIHTFTSSGTFTPAIGGTVD